MGRRPSLDTVSDKIRRMQYVNLGRTGLKVSRLCLGMMTYGDPAWRAWVLPEDRGRPIIRRAIEKGINFFDTADMYSLGASEEVTGKALREYGRRDECDRGGKTPQPDHASTRLRSWGVSHMHLRGVQSYPGDTRALVHEVLRWLESGRPRDLDDHTNSRRASMAHLTDGPGGGTWEWRMACEGRSLPHFRLLRVTFRSSHKHQREILVTYRA